jgi:hypothetical protein
MAASKTADKAKTKAKPKAPPPGAKTKAKPQDGKATNGKSKRRTADITDADATLFDPLTPGETADALRTLTENRQLSSMAKVGRYRVICTEPLVVKPPHGLARHRLARVVAYDYAADRAVDATIDLDAGQVAHLDLSRAQPMLSREEEALAMSIAMVDQRVRDRLQMGDAPQIAMHYWGRTPNDLAFARRSAAVIFGREGGHSSLVAVVDLIDQQVTQVVPAEQW